MKKIFTLFAALAMVMSMSAATKTIYCKMAQSWWKADGAAVGAYYWNPGAAPKWPGVRMTPVAGETDLWSIDLDTDKYTNIIFTRVNGSGTESDWGAKTADLTIPTDDKNLYTITSTSPVWGDPGVAGNWSVYAPDAPKTYKDITITVVANATPKIHYWDGGDKVVGTEWDAKPDMVATDEENTYSYTIKEVDEATGVKYLVVVGEVQSADQQAFENVTANFKDLLPQVSVMGIPDWTGNKMTVADDYLSASVTLTLEAAKDDYELKLTVNGEWFGSNAITITKDNNSAVFAENGDGNAKLITDLAGDYVFTYTYATKTLMVTYPEPEPEIEWMEMDLEITNLTTEVMEVEGAKYLQLAGRHDMNDADVTLFLNNYADVDDDYEVNAEYSYMTFGGMEFTVIEGVMTQTSETDKGTIYTGTVYASVTDEEEGGTMYVKFALTMYAAPATVLVLTDAIVAINEETGTLTFNVPTEEGEGYYVELAGYTEPGVYEGPQVCLLETPEVVAYGTYAEVVVENNVYTLTCKGMASAMGSRFDLTISGTVQQGPSTGVENLNGAVAPVKVIENGQLIIIRNGVKFNAAGAVVK